MDRRKQAQYLKIILYVYVDVTTDIMKFMGVSIIRIFKMIITFLMHFNVSKLQKAKAVDYTFKYIILAQPKHFNM
jgi:hypothetical protein